MRRGWFRESFGWIADDFLRLLAQLSKSESWVFIAIAGVFGGIAYFAFQFALKMDFMMRLRHMGGTACLEIGNIGVALLFFGTVFFALTMTMVFGEFAHYLDYKRRNAHGHARAAARLCAGWGAFAIVIGLAMVVFLQSRCL
ncbi:MAG: hypothetical protein H6R10_2015 [Rhodocyclaceae bacterium]|nr:hypothetical protein [Rhodocyclaceae bacterium]